MPQSSVLGENTFQIRGNNGEQKSENEQTKPIISEERRAYLRKYYRLHREKLQEYQREYNKVHKKKINFNPLSGNSPHVIVKDTYNLGDIMKASPDRAARMINQIVRGDRALSAAYRIG